jgi:disulfide bond formation protein DsbB
MNQTASPSKDLDINRLAPLAIVAASAFALAVAFAAEYGFGIEPCPLCLYQRADYAVAGLIGLAALCVAVGEKRALTVAIAGGTFAVGAGIALYHVGVEQHWWASVVCAAGDEKTPATVEQLRAMLASKPAKPCDEKDWTLFGVSMATYNVGTSVALALGCFWSAQRMRTKA